MKKHLANYAEPIHNFTKERNKTSFQKDGLACDVKRDAYGR
jgi:hypothetical protein